MHLVFATSIVPDGNPSTGYEIANAAIIDALRRAGVRVTVLGCIWPGAKPVDPDNTVVLGEVDVRTDNASARQKADWILQALRTGTTFSSIKLRAVPDATVRHALAAIGPFDAYVLNAVQMSGAFEHLFTDRPSIFVAHNVEYLSAQQNAQAATSLGKRLMFSREARLLQAVERRLCANARFVWTLADDDRLPLGVADDSRSGVLPLVTPAAKAPPACRTISCDAALIGTWTWAPNRIGLDWFLGEVLPHLPADFRIRIAGATPADLVAPRPSVELVGRVPDAIEFVRSAAVVPLASRAGSGVQLKTIEAFELGLPAVATSSSLRGIAAIPENCTRADDPRAFAAALAMKARHRSPDLDGASFVRAQLAGLDAAIAKGLSALGHGAKARAA